MNLALFAVCAVILAVIAFGTAGIAVACALYQRRERQHAQVDAATYKANFHAHCPVKAEVTTAMAEIERFANEGGGEHR